ncbi:MAG: protein translocase subunit SecD [Chlamydiales bacterium]|nr:protein translocase subunit SecD [Chlamydiales bacterium]
MDTRKKWHLFLILSVIILTLYNIFPTIFYYSKSLQAPISEQQGNKIATDIAHRVNVLKEDSVLWVRSFCQLLQIKPVSIVFDEKAPQLGSVSFSREEDALRFRQSLPRAGSLIVFTPAQIELIDQTGQEHSKTVPFKRKVPLDLQAEMFSFADENSPLYKDSLLDRASSVGSALTGIAAQDVKKILSSPAGAYTMGNLNPCFSSLSIDWPAKRICLFLHQNIKPQQLITEIAKVSQATGESIDHEGDLYTIAFHQKPDTKGILLLNVQKATKHLIDQTIVYLKQFWHPTHPDLAPEHLSIVDFATYNTLTPEQKTLCLVLYAPTLVEAAPAAFHQGSIYCFAKGLERVGHGYEKFPDSDLAKQFQSDLRELFSLLSQQGFSGHPAPKERLIDELSFDVMFEQKNSFASLLAATRENFIVRNSLKTPFLELSTQEERIITENKIDTAIHEDLLKWKDEYNAAQVHLDPRMRYDTPKPTKNIFWSNFTLHLRKLLRGNEKKVIRWGLDLSGGKTVQVELKNANNQPVTEDADIKKGINELYDRINKKGVAEVAIRQVGHHIVLDFPGSQALSGTDLVRASTMFFHIVNEKFSHPTSPFAKSTHQFLQEVWNEAKATGKTEEREIQEIARKHLYGDDLTHPAPRSEAARVLLEQGLELASPEDTITTNLIDQKISKIAIHRDKDVNEMQGHPLLIVLNNYALEGSYLENIHASYDPSKGNYLSFEVKKNMRSAGGTSKHPAKELQEWTSIFSKPKVSGTELETYSRGQGWRMAIILNGSVISCPTLNEPLQDSAMISGTFSQREVSQLATDLQGGSLTFTPHILSEKNVSPELGKADRTKGIIATLIALFLVIASMVIYYRFAGFIASAAVLLNLLIMWAVLQQLGASLSLAGIAGLILTVGMAVDANVLVFERIKEEFGITKNIQSAISAGYKKAFSAIVDSNVTTIIAALILLNFDAGPIKAFAITLIIGIGSSMFTALFMTRFYFSYWVENPKNTSLSMANWIKGSHFNFLRWKKPAFITAFLIIGLGGYLAFQERASLLGMDFTGGFTVHLEMEQDAQKSYAARVENALLAQGLNRQDIQVRELTPDHQLRILLSANLEEKGNVFANMPLEKQHLASIQYPYEKNPRIEWVVQSLEASGLKLSSSSLAKLHTQWTTMSGQMSDSMRNQAIIGLALAFAAIYLYIMFRFEYKFAIAALFCLLHDVFVTVGFMAILHLLKVPVQIDLHTVAALMTIIGYSLNDTIIIFDRIREDMHLRPQKDLSALINQALNATLSRTSITSGTTLLVLIALVCLGGASIFSFALVMLIGVVFGTLSSWFIASPLVLYFHKKELSHITKIQI